MLYTFTGGNDGAGPDAGVIGDAAGNFYGTTFGGGAAGQGVVYKLDQTGHQTVLPVRTASPSLRTGRPVAVSPAARLRASASIPPWLPTGKKHR